MQILVYFLFLFLHIVLAYIKTSFSLKYFIYLFYRYSTQYRGHRFSIRMTKDYLFRVLMQRNTKVLKPLICSLLHLDPDDVTSVTILNPIELGETIDEKN